MPTWVALLRAVNLGAHNKVSMPKLRDALAAEGFTDVKTYVNSGNVVLGSTLRSPAKVGQAVHDVILDHFGVDTPVMMRTGRQLTEVLDEVPGDTFMPDPGSAGAWRTVEESETSLTADGLPFRFVTLEREAA